MFQGQIENVAPLKNNQVLRDRKFAFILYDSSSKTTFVAADADGSVPFFWGTDAGGNIELLDDVEIVKKGCCKSLTPFPKVTCIQFNPVDDRYFISGSLDAKVYIWSIPDRQVIDWNDLHEMVTAACYTSDGQMLKW
ncbi:putative WD repeat-containing protein C18H10.05 [Camellia lanceoleosa]|uniref:WD repeat-containing protein C18H10.05 n=1 Tax=Camellia lanceoleosa TaxID=1840588 RepID=A0ACC0ICT9_9ERIC|nr:putative WD repeat-containing protein C18H10.05 [Camellia lanceoleosa]